MIENLKRGAKDYLNNLPYVGSIGKLGSYGDIIFRVGESNTLTPQDIAVSVGNETGYHSRIGKPDITEFLRRKLKTSNFNIKLIYTLSPIKTTISKLEKICDEGEHYPLIIGDMKISENNFMIRTLNYKIIKSDGNGTPLIAEVTLNLEEYISEINEKSTNKYVDKKGVKALKEKTIHNINSTIIKEIQGGRLW